MLPKHLLPLHITQSIWTPLFWLHIASICPNFDIQFGWHILDNFGPLPTQAAIAQEEVDTLTNSSSKEANAIVNDTNVSNTLHGRIWIFGISHCSASKIINVTSNDQNYHVSAISVDSSIGQSFQASFATSITSIGLSTASILRNKWLATFDPHGMIIGINYSASSASHIRKSDHNFQLLQSPGWLSCLVLCQVHWKNYWIDSLKKFAIYIDKWGSQQHLCLVKVDY